MSTLHIFQKLKTYGWIKPKIVVVCKACRHHPYRKVYKIIKKKSVKTSKSDLPYVIKYRRQQRYLGYLEKVIDKFGLPSCRHVPW